MANETRDRLVEEATKLVAVHGFAGTSVRMVTTAAGANVAAVNFHFGSQAALFESVLRGGLTRLLDDRLNGYATVLAKTDDQPAIADLVDVFVDPLLKMRRSRRAIDQAFLGILARTLIERSETYERLLRKELAAGYRTLFDAFAEACPHLNREELSNRLDFALGVLGHAFADATARSAATGVRKTANTSRLASQVKTFLVAGLQAPPALELPHHSQNARRSR